MTPAQLAPVEDESPATTAERLHEYLSNAGEALRELTDSLTDAVRK